MIPFTLPVTPMLARRVPEIPAGMAYEPKWDGFRCVAAVVDGRAQLWSRNGRDLSAYFPELLPALVTTLPTDTVLDGEIVVVVGNRLDFVKLTERIHPAARRIAALAERMPASLVFWDVLAARGTDLRGEPFADRRRQLEALLDGAPAPLFLSPLTTDLRLAQEWFTGFEGAGLDGVVAKPMAASYQPGVRAMLKIKHDREADVVVGAYVLQADTNAARPILGALQLGLYDAAGLLHWVGVAANFSDDMRTATAEMLAELAVAPDSPAWQQHPWSKDQVPDGPRVPGTVNRWNATPTKQVVLLDPMLVCQVGYEHMEGTRFRHTTQFQRWRPDKVPEECTFAQLEEVPTFDLAAILSGGRA